MPLLADLLSRASSLVSTAPSRITNGGRFNPDAPRNQGQVFGNLAPLAPILRDVDVPPIEGLPSFELGGFIEVDLNEWIATPPPEQGAQVFLYLDRDGDGDGEITEIALPGGPGFGDPGNKYIWSSDLVVNPDDQSVSFYVGTFNSRYDLKGLISAGTRGGLSTGYNYGLASEDLLQEVFLTGQASIPGFPTILTGQGGEVWRYDLPTTSPGNVDFDNINDGTWTLEIDSSVLLGPGFAGFRALEAFDETPLVSGDRDGIYAATSVNLIYDILATGNFNSQLIYRPGDGQAAGANSGGQVGDWVVVHAGPSNEPGNKSIRTMEVVNLNINGTPTEVLLVGTENINGGQLWLKLPSGDPDVGWQKIAELVDEEGLYSSAVGDIEVLHDGRIVFGSWANTGIFLLDPNPSFNNADYGIGGNITKILDIDNPVLGRGVFLDDAKDNGIMKLVEYGDYLWLTTVNYQEGTLVARIDKDNINAAISNPADASLWQVLTTNGFETIDPAATNGPIGDLSDDDGPGTPPAALPPGPIAGTFDLTGGSGSGATITNVVVDDEGFIDWEFANRGTGYARREVLTATIDGVDVTFRVQSINPFLDALSFPGAESTYGWQAEVVVEDGQEVLYIGDFAGENAARLYRISNGGDDFELVTGSLELVAGDPVATPGKLFGVFGDAYGLRQFQVASGGGDQGLLIGTAEDFGSGVGLGWNLDPESIFLLAPLTGQLRRFLFGADRDDIIVGNLFDNTIYSYAGEDIVIGLEGDDKIFSGLGEDIVAGGMGRDWIYGGDNEDLIYGDSIFGVDFDELLPLLVPPTEGAPGLGQDLLQQYLQFRQILVEANQNFDPSQDNSDIIYGEGGNDVAFGGDDGDTMYGGEGNDLLVGEEGDDVLYGEAGNDLLIGGLGADTARGGTGVDKYSLNDDSALASSPILGDSDQEPGPPVGDGEIDIITFYSADFDGVEQEEYVLFFEQGVDKIGLAPGVRYVLGAADNEVILKPESGGNSIKLIAGTDGDEIYQTDFVWQQSDFINVV